jgi:tetratricopeptide (TPR) repeat protein
MVPTIGFVQIDLHALADRYAYVAFIGLFIMLCWGISDWAQSSRLGHMLPILGVLVCVALGVRTRQQVSYWSDRITLWTHTLDVTHHNWVADYRLGNAFHAAGQNEKALAFFYQAALDVPNEPVVYLQIAIIEHQRRNLTKAIEAYQKVLDYTKAPEVKARVLANMGHAYGDLGEYDKAKYCFEQANLYAR